MRRHAELDDVEVLQADAYWLRVRPPAYTVEPPLRLTSG